MFKTVPVAETTYRADTLPADAHDFAHHMMTLGWEDRARTRGRRRSNDGIEFWISLARGSMLRAGDCLVIAPLRAVVEVIELVEPVFVVEPGTPGEWALFAYHIGNGHQPLMVTEKTLVCPDLPGVEMLLQYHRIPHTRADMAFTPTSAFGHQL